MVFYLIGGIGRSFFHKPFLVAIIRLQYNVKKKGWQMLAFMLILVRQHMGAPLESQQPPGSL
jgi:hypothetical protein